MTDLVQTTAYAIGIAIVPAEGMLLSLLLLRGLHRSIPFFTSLICFLLLTDATAMCLIACGAIESSAYWSLYLFQAGGARLLEFGVAWELCKALLGEMFVDWVKRLGVAMAGLIAAAVIPVSLMVSRHHFGWVLGIATVYPRFDAGAGILRTMACLFLLAIILLLPLTAEEGAAKILAPLSFYYLAVEAAIVCEHMTTSLASERMWYATMELFRNASWLGAVCWMTYSLAISQPLSGELSVLSGGTRRTPFQAAVAREKERAW